MSQVTNSVRFVLDGQIVEAQGARRTTTVLDYLREQLQRTGTKEGCAEGDCGACVVLVGELDSAQEHIHYVPTNACIQLLPSLDGKALKTVESLRHRDGQLHPVQQAMIDCHGSQCGFCTPGMVMSLAGLLATVASPTRTQVNNALSGNLCRCTGYKPIVDAAIQASGAAQESLALSSQADVQLLKQIARAKTPSYNLEGDIVVQPVVRTRKGSEFVSPATIEELAHYLSEHPQATLIAGSTEIGLQVNKQFARPSHIVYLGNVAQLRQIEETKTHWRIGAQVALTQVEQCIGQAYPDFAEVLRRFGSPPIRSTATLAGNIANGSPIGDSMPCLMALGADLTLRCGEQSREVALDAFYTGQKKNVLRSGEFIVSVNVPKPVAGQVFRAHKVSKRFEQDISATCCALSYQIIHGKLAQVRLAYNGLTPFPSRSPKLEALLTGRSPGDVTAQALDEVIAGSFPARDGLRATWTYRSLVARNLVLSFLESQEVAA
jgi:xanthine dehydrogenase small subunit